MGKEPTKMMTIHNRFSDESFTQSCQLPAFAVAIYDTIIGAERTEDYTLMQKGITRSEERRVGKECGYMWARTELKAEQWTE